MDLLFLINEANFEIGKGSSAGRSKMLSAEKTRHDNPKKSRVKIYNSITDALKRGYVSQIFSTKNSDRLYVITKRKWGKDDEQEVSGRVAKGFSPQTIPSDFSDVKKYAARTAVRHGKSSNPEYRKEFKSKRKD